jgi:hypothetical protein
MKITIFAVLAGAVLVSTGCVRTVSDTSTFAVSYGQDSVAGRYNRSCEQVYKASYDVVSSDGGVIVKEQIPHAYTNAVRQLEARVNDCKVYIRVEQIDPNISQVDVEARTKWGRTDLDLVHELEKDIALKLATSY